MTAVAAVAAPSRPPVWDRFRRMAIDLAADPPVPRYLVHGLMRRGKVYFLAADTGLGKTWFSMALVCALLARAPFLERRTDCGKPLTVVVIDAENGTDLVLERLRALGLEQEHVERLVYFSFADVPLRPSEEEDPLDELLSHYKADLLVIETLGSAGGIAELNSNDEALAVMARMNALAERRDCAILISHHVRKDAQGSRGEAMMGARQYAGQTSGLWTLRPDGTPESRPDGHGSTLTERCLVLETPKMRHDPEIAPETVRLSIVTDELGRIDMAGVIGEGAKERKQSETDALRGTLLELLGAGTKSRAELLEVTDAAEWRLDKAATGLVKDGLIRRKDRGVYEIVATPGEPVL